MIARYTLFIAWKSILVWILRKETLHIHALRCLRMDFWETTRRFYFPLEFPQQKEPFIFPNYTTGSLNNIKSNISTAILRVRLSADFHHKYAIASADKASNNIVWLQDTLYQRLERGPSFEYCERKPYMRMHLMEEILRSNKTVLHVLSFGIFAIEEDLDRAPRLHKASLRYMKIHICNVNVLDLYHFTVS